MSETDIAEMTVQALATNFDLKGGDIYESG